MPTLNISNQEIAITKRFFEVIDMLIAQKRIRGLQTFTRNHDLNFGNMVTLKNYPDTHSLKPICISYLVRDFDVCANYVLLGIGPMFKREYVAPVKPPKKPVGRPPKK